VFNCISLRCYDIPELVVPIRISLIKGMPQIQIGLLHTLTYTSKLEVKSG